MDIKQIASTITTDQFNELLARFYIREATAMANDGGIEADEICQTAGWMATQGAYSNVDVPIAIINILKEEAKMKREKVEWIGYIPDDGHWDLPDEYTSERQARAALRKMLELKRLPAGSWVMRKSKD